MMNCLIGDLAKEFLRHQKIKRGTFVSFFKLFCKGKATISNLWTIGYKGHFKQGVIYNQQPGNCIHEPVKCKM